MVTKLFARFVRYLVRFGIEQAIETAVEKMAFKIVDYYFDGDDFETDTNTEFDWDFELIFDLHGSGQSKTDNGNTNNSGNHGVVNYSFYNTTYQNSMDLSGIMSSSSTAYGHEGGNTATQNNKPDPFSGLLSGLTTAAGLLPLLADSKVEDFENSDRIDCVRAGASGAVTQHTVGALVFHEENLPVHPSSASDEPAAAGPAVKRFVDLTIGEWQATQPPGSGWYVPLPYAVCQENTPFGALARRHFLLNCGWDVVVQVNSTRFHAGALLVAMVPQFVATNQVGPFKGSMLSTEHPDFPLQQMFLYPHQIINPRTNSSAHIKVPYVAQTPAVDPLEQAPWTLVVLVLDTLQYAAGASTTLTINGLFCPVDAIFHGIRTTNSAFQGLVKNKNESSAYSFCTTQAHYAEPVYGHMTRSSPRFLPGKFTDLLQVAKQHTLVNDFVVVFQQTAPQTPLLELDLSLASTSLLNSSLETVSRLFAQYRGSINLRILFTGNQMVNLRFAMVYTPPGAEKPTTLRQALASTYTIFDTGLNSAAIFNVPFISTTDYRYCNVVGNDDSSLGGYVTIWQVTNLAIPPGSPPTAHGLVFVSAGSDFEFRCPTTMWMTLQGGTEITPGETGTDVDAGPDNSNENALDIPQTPVRQSPSAIRFLFDRFFPLDVINVPNKASAPAIIPLTAARLFKYTPEILEGFHATFYRFELEIAAKCFANEATNAHIISPRFIWVRRENEKFIEPT